MTSNVTWKCHSPNCEGHLGEPPDKPKQHEPNKSLQRTFVIVKGDSVRRGLVGKIISRFEDKGLKIICMEFRYVREHQAEELYKEHAGREFFRRLVAFTISTPVVLMILEGNHAVSVVRNLIGETNCCAAAPGTIRGDFGASCSNRTLVHASRSNEDFERETKVVFPELGTREDYQRCDWGWNLELEAEGG